MAERPPLLSDAELAEQGPPEAVRLPIALIDPSEANPRRTLQEVDQLAASIADPEIGLLQPIAVRRLGDRYEVISGHRRRAAFLLLAEREPHDVRWRTIPAVVRTMGDEQSYLALLSAQLHNRNWAPKEESAALERLAETRTLAAVGSLVHKSESWVSRRLKLYNDSVLSAYVQTRRLAPGVAEELLTIKDPAVKRQLAEQAATEQWSHDQARRAARALTRDAELHDLNRQVGALLRVLSEIEPSRIPIETFRQLWVLHGRVELLSELARGGAPKFPSIEAAQQRAGVRMQDKPTRTRRAGYKPRR